MPSLNPALTNVPSDAIVIWRGQPWVNLQRLIDSLAIGQIQIIYSTGTGAATGFQIQPDFSRTKLFLPPPKLGDNLDWSKLSVEAMQVCLEGDIPATRNVVIVGA